MQINDVKRDVEDLWSETSAFWQDEMSKKYKTTMLDSMGSILDSMQNSCGQLTLAIAEALRRLKEVQK